VKRGGKGKSQGQVLIKKSTKKEVETVKQGGLKEEERMRSKAAHTPSSQRCIRVYLRRKTNSTSEAEERKGEVNERSGNLGKEARATRT